MTDPIIRLENVSYRYPQAPRPALTNVSLEFARGSFTAILGHNGSGKSTLAKHLNAILLPERGRVLINGMDTSEESRLLDIRRTVGMVFQNPDNQIVASVVEDDVAFAPENLGLPREEIRRRVDESLRRCGMYELRRHAPHLLSGGQKQRVAIAGVLAMEPEVLVLDEPTAMLDPSGRREVLHTVEELRRDSGVTVVLITHHMEECIRCDRLLVMENGQVALDGSPREIFPQVERLRALHLNVPETTELLWELQQHRLDVPLDALDSRSCARAIAALLRS